MTCPQCRTEVPEASAFCLSCGTRLAKPERSAPGDGTGASKAGAPAALAPATPGGKQAYTLSFRPIPDERLRYRVARWVCERAPAHGLGEVQDGLLRGDFFTFLALTAEEAEAARQGVHGLGLAPGWLHLAPATTAELLLERPAPKGAASVAGIAGKKNWIVVAIIIAALVGVGLVVVRLFGGSP